MTLLEPNQRFIEAYLVGPEPRDGARAALARVSDRSARQLLPAVLGREPGAAAGPDACAKASRCATSRSSTVAARTPSSGPIIQREAQGRRRVLVLVVRGELLKRYPTAVIYAQKAEWHTATARST